MIVTFYYPKKRILYPKEITSQGGTRMHPNEKRELSLIVSSMICNDFEKIDKCNLQVFYSKRANKRSYARKRYYFTNKELKEICLKLFSKYYLKDAVILNWQFKELEPSYAPKIIVKVIKI